MTIPCPYAAILSPVPGGVSLKLKVVPNASRTRIAGVLGDRLKVLVSAPPEDGKANVAVCELITNVLGKSSRDVTLVSGLTQPLKTVRVAGVDAQQAATLLAALNLK